MANWLSGYTTRRKITIDKDKIDDTLTDFPVLVKLTSTNFDFSKANSDGFDIRFTSSDGTTLLKYERERHDSANKLAEYWVKIPSISSSANTDFYIYFRTTDTADGADPANVWDSNFKARYSMKDLTTSTIEDSTSNNNDGTKKSANEPVEADGQIGKAQSFDGSNDYIDCGNGSSLDITGDKLTMEAWIYPYEWNQNDYVVSKYSSTGGGYGMGITDEGGNTLKAFITNSGGDQLALMNVTKTINTWHHYVATYDGSNIRFFWNGSLIDAVAVTGNITSTTSHLLIGRLGGYSHYYKGIIDEVRISNIARSAAWIKASYNSGNNSLVSYGAEEGIDNAIFFGINL